MDTLVVIGKVGKKGQLKYKKPINLTNFGPAIQSVDTAVAINRTNKNNIVVSYGVINRSVSPHTAIPYRAVSFDGGKTWPAEWNGPINVLPTGVPSQFGDNRGVASDKFGNIWYNSTNLYDDFGDFVDTPYFAVSVDGGITFSLVYTAPLPVNLNVEFYDFPAICFGGDGQGNYGLHFVVDYTNGDTGDIIPAVGFIPITGLGMTGPVSFVKLQELVNSNFGADLTASADGRVWFQGIPDANGGVLAAFSYIQPVSIVFKSPGDIDVNYAGSWQFGMYNAIGIEYQLSIQDSQPGYLGYLVESVQSILYDDKRQALYALFSAQFPDTSQNARIYFLISRNNGQTWSDPIDISTTDFANRGFQSMVLDSKTGNLIFGWYDGRNDPTYKAVEYFAAVILACELDKLVNSVPLSNPLYSLPSATDNSIIRESTDLPISKKDKALKRTTSKHFARKLTDRSL